MKYATALLFTGANAAIFGGGWNSAPVAPSYSAPDSWSKPSGPSYSTSVGPIKPPTQTWTTYTDVVTAVTTYCSTPTEIVHNSKTYTVSTATTLTITNCPCTLTYSSWSSWTPAPTTTPEAVVVPTTSVYTTPAAPYNYSNATSLAPVVTYAPSSSPVKSSSTPPVATVNAASNKLASAGAALAGVFGAVVYLL